VEKTPMQMMSVRVIFFMIKRFSKGAGKTMPLITDKIGCELYRM